jgi:hypothetical protein
MEEEQKKYKELEKEAYIPKHAKKDEEMTSI